MASMTLNGLCEAICNALRVAAAADKLPSRATLVVYGTPADDATRALLEMAGGVLRIEIRDLPAALEQRDVEVLAANLWKPGICNERSNEDCAGSRGDPSGQNTGGCPQPAPGGSTGADHR